MENNQKSAKMELRKIGSSKLYLVLAIVISASMALGTLVSMVSVLASFGKIISSAQGGGDFKLNIGGSANTNISILSLISIWLIYAGCKTNKDKLVNTAGILMVVESIITIVAISIALGVIGIAILILLVATIAENGAIIIAAIVIMLAVLPILIVQLLYQITKKNFAQNFRDAFNIKSGNIIKSMYDTFDYKAKRLRLIKKMGILTFISAGVTTILVPTILVIAFTMYRKTGEIIDVDLFAAIFATIMFTIILSFGVEIFKGVVFIKIDKQLANISYDKPTAELEATVPYETPQPAETTETESEEKEQ